MFDLVTVLNRLHLHQYYEGLVENGFDTWEAVLGITEQDLDVMGWKLGHRRVLQREIADCKGVAQQNAMLSDNAVEPSPPPTASTSEPSPGISTESKHGRRRYRRHPRIDTNAPKRPKTAYVLFADHLRNDASIKNLSFVEIARVVGQKWQSLPVHVKRVWEHQAADAMHEYALSMDAYKLTQDFKQYQAYLTDFKRKHGQTSSREQSGSSQRAASMIRPTLLDFSDSSGDSSSLRTSEGTSVSGAGDAEDGIVAIEVGLQEIAKLEYTVQQAQPPGTQLIIYNERRLPEYHAIKQATDCFFAASEKIMHFFPEEQMDQLLHKIYQDQNTSILCEVLALAALGCSYAPGRFPDDIRRSYFVSCARNLALCTMDDLRFMRIFAVLAAYAAQERHLGAQQILSAALQVSRRNMARHHDTNIASTSIGGSMQWAKVLRTTVILDSWLCYTLGLNTQTIPQDVEFFQSLLPSSSTMSSVDALQGFSANISLIASAIAVDTRFKDDRRIDAYTCHAERLAIWRASIPPSMHISNLLAQDCPLSTQERHGFLLMHIVYLGAVLLLHQQVASSETSRTVKDELALQQQSNAQAAGAIEQLLYIAAWLNQKEDYSRKNWIIITAYFSACLMLLYHCQSCLHSSDYNAAGPILQRARICLGVLRHCTADRYAKHFADTLTPHCDRLAHVIDAGLQPMKRPRSSDIYKLLDSRPDSIQPTKISGTAEFKADDIQSVSKQLAYLLRDPFGRNQERLSERRENTKRASSTSPLCWWAYPDLT